MINEDDDEEQIIGVDLERKSQLPSDFRDSYRSDLSLKAQEIEEEIKLEFIEEDECKLGN